MLVLATGTSKSMTVEQNELHCCCEFGRLSGRLSGRLPLQQVCICSLENQYVVWWAQHNTSDALSDTPWLNRTCLSAVLGLAPAEVPLLRVPKSFATFCFVRLWKHKNAAGHVSMYAQERFAMKINELKQCNTPRTESKLNARYFGTEEVFYKSRFLTS